MNTATKFDLIKAHFPDGRKFRHIRNCGICNSPIGYRINGQELFFDGNCACMAYLTPVRPANWEDLQHLLPVSTPTLQLKPMDTTTHLIEAAIEGHGLDPDYYALSYMTEAYNAGLLDLTNIDQLLQFSKRGMVLELLRKNQTRKAQELCLELALDFDTVRYMLRGRRKA